MNTPEGMVRRYFEALSSSDLDGTVEPFADDAVVMADGFDTASGTAQLRATYQAAFASMRIDERVEIDDTQQGYMFNSPASEAE